METSLQFVERRGRVPGRAGEHLALDPVVNTVVATFAERTIRAVAEGSAQPEEDWWLVVRDGTGAVVGAGMRTAPFAPRPAFLLPMPSPAARLLARRAA